MSSNSATISELEQTITKLLAFYHKYCALTGTPVDHSFVPKHLVMQSRDLPALLKPKKIQS